ncbi:MAG: cytochrome C [Candidatus Tectomicrobia bacterium]|uniref:Cytochrome C n=1 Tax=Tectimicrobiota bacterium TaxID=2528274 RepID=A0A932I3P2_UNCTE|nr:cytochrome C [Candidatus Tectomicrobia bacterium]
MPGPADRIFRRIPPLAALLISPVLGTVFVLGFIFLTLAAMAIIPVKLIRRGRGGRAAGLFLAGAVLLGGPAAWGQAVSNEMCINCHKLPLQMKLKDGSSVSLQIPAADFGKSAHGSLLLCTACHTDIKKVPHDKLEFEDRRALSLHYSRACTSCHGGKFKEFQEGIHWRLLSAGDRRAPLCADCHGAHAITKGGVAKGFTPQACAKCHEKPYRQYETSVHGRGLIQNGAKDVPGCSTCHPSHTGQDPRKMEFRINIPQLCADCHQNKPLMEKYGLSSQVVSTYLEDFHGASISLYREQRNLPPRLTAVCTDCHGIHDILRVKDPDSKVVRENLMRTCQKCHPDASLNFPASWLSHYPPSTTRYPLVFFLRLFYFIFVPAIIACMLFHVGLDFAAELRARRRSRKERA